MAGSPRGRAGVLLVSRLISRGNLRRLFDRFSLVVLCCSLLPLFLFLVLQKGDGTVEGQERLHLESAFFGRWDLAIWLLPRCDDDEMI